MSRQRFEWIEFHRHLHKAKCIDSRSVSVTALAPRQVTYDFCVRGQINLQTGNVIPPYGEQDIAMESLYVPRGFATSLKILFPCLDIMVGDSTTPKHMNLDRNEIRTIYWPRTNREVNKILGYLRTVRVAGGFMPKEGATSFWYD